MRSGQAVTEKLTTTWLTFTVQFNLLLADRRSLLFERLEGATGGQNHCLGLGGN